MAKSTTDVAVVPAEYSTLFRFERSASAQRFRLHFDQGAAFAPNNLPLVRDRATFFGYRGAQTRWGYGIAVAGGLTGGFAVAGGASWWRESGLTVGLVLSVVTVGASVVRSRQARRRHPNYRQYQLDPDVQNWHLPVPATTSAEFSAAPDARALAGLETSDLSQHTYQRGDRRRPWLRGLPEGIFAGTCVSAAAAIALGVAHQRDWVILPALAGAAGAAATLRRAHAFAAARPERSVYLRWWRQRGLWLAIVSLLPIWVALGAAAVPMHTH